MAKKKSSSAAANGNGNHAAPEPVTEQKRDSSPEPDRKAEQLKTLNSMLLKEAVERRGQVAALTARLEEISADGDALGAAERAVARAALAAPLRAAADEAAALRARLAALQDSLRLAESSAALEAGAKDEARARLEEAAGEKARFLKLLQVKEAEVASISNKVSSLAAVMAELEANNSVLLGQNGELGKELEEAKEAVRVVLGQKAEVERSFQEFKDEMEAYRVEMEGKLKAKEVASKAFDAEKTEITKELQSLKRMVEETHADKEAAEGATRDKDAQAIKLRAELEELHVSMAQLQTSCDELDTKHSRLQSEKNSVQKALAAEKAEAGKLMSKIQTMENRNGKMDSEIGELRVALKEKNGKIEDLTNEAELLQLAVAEAQKRNKGGIWAWVYAATTTMVAAISLIYATRAQ